ncbi:hypothetical protein LT493_11330 [Streptomyces tricolor]|nr:hypothetical protein [Streptomyces tricolor]
MNPRTQQCAAPEAGAVTPTEVPNAVTLASVVSSTVALTALQPEDEARIEWSMKPPANLRIRREARMRTRMRLTIAHWTGDIDAAARVAAELADNAVKHGGPFLDGSVILRLSVDPKTGELLVGSGRRKPCLPQFRGGAVQPTRTGLRARLRAAPAGQARMARAAGTTTGPFLARP